MPFTGPTDRESASVRRVNVGSIRAGLGREMHDWRPGQVPDFATINASVRFGPGQSEESVISDIRREFESLARQDPGIRTEVEAVRPPTRPPPRPFFVEQSARIVREAVANHQIVFGREPAVGAVAPYRYYGSDASHLQHIGNMTGIVCGAGGKYNTMPDERVELDQFRGAVRMYALTTLAMCQ